MSKKDMSFKNLVSKTYSLLRRHWFYFIKMVAVFLAPIFTLDVLLWLKVIFKDQDAQRFSLRVLDAVDQTVMLVTVLWFLLYFVVIVRVSCSLDCGKKVGTISAYRQAFNIFGSYLWVKTLYIMRVLGWSLLLLVPGVVFGIFYSCASAAFIIDQKRGVKALIASNEMIKPNVLFYLKSIVGAITIVGTACVLFVYYFDSVIAFFALSGNTFMKNVFDGVETVFLTAAATFLAVFYYCLYMILRDGQAKE